MPAPPATARAPIFHATAQGYATITPLRVDLTHHALLPYWAPTASQLSKTLQSLDADNPKTWFIPNWLPLPAAAQCPPETGFSAKDAGMAGAVDQKKDSTRCRRENRVIAYSSPFVPSVGVGARPAAFRGHGEQVAFTGY